MTEQQPTTGANETHEAAFDAGEVVYIGPFVVEGQCEIGWGLHVDGAIDRWEAGDRIVSATRVLDDAAAAAIAALRELDRAQMALSAANTVEGITAAASLVYRTYRAITDDQRARIDRILAADAARTEGQQQ